MRWDKEEAIKKDLDITTLCDVSVGEKKVIRMTVAKTCRQPVEMHFSYTRQYISI
jgi:hypothetical protein